MILLNAAHARSFLITILFRVRRDHYRSTNDIVDQHVLKKINLTLSLRNIPLQNHQLGRQEMVTSTSFQQLVYKTSHGSYFGFLSTALVRRNAVASYS